MDTTPHPHPATPDSGFTLVELMVLLIIMGLAALLVLPSFTSGLRGLELEAVSRDDSGAGFYVLANEFGEELGSVDLPEGVLPRTVDDSPLPWRVSFYSNGRSSGGAIGLINRQEKLLYVSANAVTGLARVSARLEAEGRPQ